MPDRPAALGELVQEAIHVLPMEDDLFCVDLLGHAFIADPDTEEGAEFVAGDMRTRLVALLERAYDLGVAAGRDEAARIAEQHVESPDHIMVDTGSMWRSASATTIAAAIRRATVSPL